MTRPPQQVELLPPKGRKGGLSPTGSIVVLVTPNPLATALSVYRNHLLASSYSEHTGKAFLYVLKLLGRFLGLNKPIGQISAGDLNGWLTYLRKERGGRCNLRP